MPAEDLGRVIYETEGPVARIVLNWPEKANSQSTEMVCQLDAASISPSTTPRSRSSS